MKKNIENPQIKAGKTSQHLSEEEKKNKKCQYTCKQYRNLSKDEKNKN